MEPSRYITRKPCRDCGIHTSAVLDPAQGHYLGERAWGKVEGKGPVFYWNANHAVLCRGCGKPRFARYVVGKFKPGVECNTKCQNSHGPSCECRCKGVNHGASFAA